MDSLESDRSGDYFVYSKIFRGANTNAELDFGFVFFFKPRRKKGDVTNLSFLNRICLETITPNKLCSGKPKLV